MTIKKGSFLNAIFAFILAVGFFLFASQPVLAQSYKNYRDCVNSPTCITQKCEWDDQQDGYVCLEQKPPPKRQAPEPGTVINPIAPNLSPASGSDAVGLFSRLVQVLVTTSIVIASVVFFFMFLIGAIKWITSSGDKAQIESARGTIMNALVGLIIVFSIFALLKLLETLFGVDILQINVGALRIR